MTMFKFIHMYTICSSIYNAEAYVCLKYMLFDLLKTMYLICTCLMSAICLH